VAEFTRVGDDLIASYSSKGPTLVDHVMKPDLVAPGNRVVSLMAVKTYLPINYSSNKIQLSTYQGATTSGPAGKTARRAPLLAGQPLTR
jgi:serine protease AprX